MSASVVLCTRVHRLGHLNHSQLFPERVQWKEQQMCGRCLAVCIIICKPLIDT